MRYLPLAVILMAASAAQAQYKCTTPAGVTFQQIPCPKEATERRVGPKPEAPPEKPWISPDRPEHIRKAFEQGLIVPGMFMFEVRQLIGRDPDRVNTTGTAGGETQQLIYGAAGRTMYLYTAGGVVTAFQTFRR